MAKSFRFKNNIYLDSSAVMHNKELLSTFIENINTHNNTQQTQISDIYYRLGGLGTQCKTVSGDWNTACGTATGFYMGNGLSNSPTDMTTVSSWFYVIHIVHNALFMTQIFLSFGTNQISMRNMNNGNWNPFIRII